MTYTDLLITLNFDPNFAALNATQKKGLVNAQIKKLFDCIKGNDGCRDFYSCGNEILGLHATPSSAFNACADVLISVPSSTFNACADVLISVPSSTFNACL